MTRETESETAIPRPSRDTLRTLGLVVLWWQFVLPAVVWAVVVAMSPMGPVEAANAIINEFVQDYSRWFLP